MLKCLFSYLLYTLYLPIVASAFIRDRNLLETGIYPITDGVMMANGFILLGNLVKKYRVKHQMNTIWFIEMVRRFLFPLSINLRIKNPSGFHADNFPGDTHTFPSLLNHPSSKQFFQFVADFCCSFTRKSVFFFFLQPSSQYRPSACAYWKIRGS